MTTKKNPNILDARYVYCSVQGSELEKRTEDGWEIVLMQDTTQERQMGPYSMSYRESRYLLRRPRKLPEFQQLRAELKTLQASHNKLCERVQRAAGEAETFVAVAEAWRTNTPKPKMAEYDSAMAHRLRQLVCLSSHLKEAAAAIQPKPEEKR